MRVDPEQLCCALLGYRQIIFERELKSVYRVYPPEFGEVVDVLIIEYPGGHLRAVLNPWTTSQRLSRVRASSLISAVDEVHDAAREIETGTAWLAPDEAAGRRLAQRYLDSIGSRKSVDPLEGRARRDWQVELALRQQYSRDVGGLMKISDVQIAFVIDDDV